MESNSREQVLRRMCDGDESLRREVESLLEFHEQEDELLDRPCPEVTGVQSPREAGEIRAETLKAGTRVGEFTIESPLGAGGMGVVYVARQQRPARTVALKLIRAGLLTREMLRRFEHEGDLLGRLRHPGIAQVYQAGTSQIEEGREQPFIAMELVRGLPLVEHAASNALDERGKVALVARIARAVQHAHSRGVIHRDLKPGNILVEPNPESSGEDSTITGLAGPVGQPKILDFGVARAVDREPAGTLRTTVGQIVGTLAYMSPEQVLGDPAEVDSRTDVYAIGVILYQLLAGKLPLDLNKRSIVDAARIIREEDPARLSTIHRRFSGDLDTIVAKAMEKDRNRRYRTAAELADDLERYLRGEPIAARRDSTVYVLRKQLNRYRGVVIAAGLVTTSLAALAVYAAVQARHNRKMAEELASQLAIANIERGRSLAVSAGMRSGAELLWAEWLRDPGSARAHWALWELYSERPILRTVLETPAYQTSALLNDPNDRRVYRGTREGMLQCWSADVERLEWELSLGNRPLRQMALSADGGLLCVDTENAGPVLVDTKTRTKRDLLPAPEREAIAIAFTADSGAVVTGDNRGTITVTPIAGGTPLISTVESRSIVKGILVHPTRPLAVVIMSTGPMTIRSTTDWSITGRIDDFKRGTQCATFTPDGESLLAAFGDGSVRQYSVEDWSEKAVFQTGTHVPSSIIVLSDKRTFVLGSRAGAHVWDYRSKRVIADIPLGESTRLDIVPGKTDETMVAVSGVGPLMLMQTRPYMGAGTFENPGSKGLSCVTVRQAGDIAAGTDTAGGIRLWDLTSRKIIAQTQGPGRASRSAAFSMDGKRLYVAFGNGRLVGYSVPELKPFADAMLFEGTCSAVAVHPASGVVVAGGGRPARIVSLDPDALKQTGTWPAHDTALTSLVFSPDGSKLLSTGQEPGLVLRSWPEMAVLADRPDSFMNFSATFAPETSASSGKKLLAHATSGAAIDLLDASTLALTRRMRGHGFSVTSTAFAPGGDQLVSGGADGSIRLWDPRTGAGLARLSAQATECSSLAFVPGTSTFMSCSTAGDTYLWDLAYYDRHIAGNLAYWHWRLTAQTELGREALILPQDVRREAAERWARKALKDPTFSLPAGAQAGLPLSSTP